MEAELGSGKIKCEPLEIAGSLTEDPCSSRHVEKTSPTRVQNIELLLPTTIDSLALSSCSIILSTSWILWLRLASLWSFASSFWRMSMASSTTWWSVLYRRSCFLAISSARKGVKNHLQSFWGKFSLCGSNVLSISQSCAVGGADDVEFDRGRVNRVKSRPKAPEDAFTH